MRTFGKFLSASAGVIMAALAASAIFAAKPAPFAPTPRKPNYRPSRKIASRGRAEARADAENRFYKQLSKEREIGVDPIHLHSAKRQWAEPRDVWLKKSRAWDQAHG